MLDKLVSLLSLVLVVAGCGATFRSVEAVREIPGVVRIELVKTSGDLIIASVTNQGQIPLIVNRDAIVLKTSHGPLRRTAGGAVSAYTVPPGSRQQINLRYEVSLVIAGETVHLAFDEAIVDTMGARVGAPSIALIKE